jgi:hypothetical protein
MPIATVVLYDSANPPNLESGVAPNASRGDHFVPATQGGALTPWLFSYRP